MSARRVSSPPALPGFRFVSLIGSGGYADVFLYEQDSPRRRVAIKVLDAAALTSDGVTDYTQEANVMAMVSAHPYIVQVFGTGVSPDGRPYLVMEYYPGLNFQQRAKWERLSVAEVLQVGIQIGSALETAHNAGILHRDIKPANILTSEYRRPGLTDFGIAAVEGPAASASDGGLSIPWSPPELLGDARADRRSEVYSLAATLYTMLAGRSPFEISGGDNRPLALINRIESSPVPPVGRADVSDRLERVLAGAMAKDPYHRPATVADFARQLQAVESELQYPVTQLELAESDWQGRQRTDELDDDATRVKGVTQIDAQQPSVTATDGLEDDSSLAADAPQRSGRRILAEPEIDNTIVRPKPDPAAPPAYEAPAGISKSVWIASGVVGVLVVIVLVMVFRGGEQPVPENDPAIAIAEINDNVGDDIGGPTAVRPRAVPEVVVTDMGDGRYKYTWEDQGDDVTYAVRAGDSPNSVELDEPELVTSEACIEVEVIASTGLMSAPTRGCVP